jgi:hypothetical protein
MFAEEKHSSLFWGDINDEARTDFQPIFRRFLQSHVPGVTSSSIRAQCYKTFSLRNLRIFVVS